MYTLIGTEKSRAFRVLWMLEELGQPYAHRPEPPRSDAVLAHNGSGKIPVLLLDDGTALSDSTAILTYLADVHGQLTHPAGTPGRARQDGWTHRILDEIDSVLWTAARHSFILPEEMRVPQIKDSLKAEYTRSLQRITDEMPGEWLMGDTFTLADIVLAHCGGWARIAGFPTDNTAFGAYIRRARARPAFLRLTAAMAAR